MGYDVHQLVKGRELWMGGIKLEHELWLLGHSDADVVTHAVVESILGALALGDLGKHFPDNDPKFSGISSLFLLDEVVGMMQKEGFQVSNIDVQIACKFPKLSDKICDMRKTLAEHLKTSISNVSVKACSYNEVGPIGNGEAIKASSYVLLEK